MYVRTFDCLISGYDFGGMEEALCGATVGIFKYVLLF